MTEFVIAMRKEMGAASDLFKLARRCQGCDEFLAKCQMEEEWVLSQEAGQMQVTELPKAWTQAKSDIKGAFKAGLDLTKIPSYYKMKLAKAEANGAAKASKEASDATEVPAPNTGAEGKERDAKPDNSLAEALAAGTVVDAQSTELVPAQLRELVKLLGKLSNASELRFAQRVKEFSKTVNDDLSLIGAERAKGQQRRAS